MEQGNTTKNRVNEILKLIGPAVLLRCLGKRPTAKQWQNITLADMSQEYLGKLRTNIGVLLGEPSNGLCVIDVDDDDLVSPFLTLNPWLGDTLRTRGARGCGFWLRFSGDYPKDTRKWPGGEYRANGSQSIIHGIHPDTGKPYQMLVRAPALSVDYQNLCWPSGFTEYTESSESSDVIKGGVLPSPLPSVYSVNGASVYSVNSLESAVSLSLPSAPRCNNSSLFKLARALKSLELKKPLSPQDFSTAFSQWYDRTKALGFIRHSKDDYFNEFMNAIATAKYPLGESPIDTAWAKAQSEPLPKEADHFEEQAPKMLVALCYQLAQASAGKPWYLSCRSAAKLVGLSPQACAKWLRGLAAIRILEITSPGTKRAAARYNWKST